MKRRNRPTEAPQRWKVNGVKRSADGRSYQSLIRAVICESGTHPGSFGTTAATKGSRVGGEEAMDGDERRPPVRIKACAVGNGSAMLVSALPPTRRPCEGRLRTRRATTHPLVLLDRGDDVGACRGFWNVHPGPSRPFPAVQARRERNGRPRPPRTSRCLFLAAPVARTRMRARWLCLAVLTLGSGAFHCAPSAVAVRSRLVFRHPQLLVPSPLRLLNSRSPLASRRVRN